MRRASVFCLLLALGCATTATTATNGSRSAQASVSKCHLIGLTVGYAGYNPRNAILVENETMGPSRVYWVNPPGPSVIKTADGLMYRCDTKL